MRKFLSCFHLLLQAHSRYFDGSRWPSTTAHQYGKLLCGTDFHSTVLSPEFWSLCFLQSRNFLRFLIFTVNLELLWQAPLSPSSESEAPQLPPRDRKVMPLCLYITACGVERWCHIVVVVLNQCSTKWPENKGCSMTGALYLPLQRCRCFGQFIPSPCSLQCFSRQPREHSSVVRAKIVRRVYAMSGRAALHLTHQHA